MTRHVSAEFMATARPIACLAAWVVALLAVAATSGPAHAASASPWHTTVLYSSPSNQTFIDNTDSLTRGALNNPFGTHSSVSSISEATDGPFPGDEAVYSFNVYADKALTRQIGSALYTCEYTFGRNGFCDATFELSGGTVIGAGILNFSSKAFTLAVTGGDGKYSEMVGDLQTSASGNHAQRLRFTLAST
jgi:hypothetical protein